MNKIAFSHKLGHSIHFAKLEILLIVWFFNLQFCEESREKAGLVEVIET